MLKGSEQKFTVEYGSRRDIENNLICKAKKITWYETRGKSKTSGPKLIEDVMTV